MKICWDNLEGLRFSVKTGLLRKPDTTIYWHIKDSCKYCGAPFLGRFKDSIYCDALCFYKDNPYFEDMKGENHPLYGHNMSPESKEKISNSMKVCYSKGWKPRKNKKHSEKTKKKIAQKAKGNKRWLGKKHSDETIKKMSDYRKYNPISKFGRIKQSKTIKGPGNPNWRDGIAHLPYCSTWTDYLKSQIKERDDYKCQNPLCEHPHAPLCVHHINYIKKDCDSENLITLCMVCNSKANKDRQWHEAYYTAIMDKHREQRLINIGRAKNEVY